MIIRYLYFIIRVEHIKKSFSYIRSVCFAAAYAYWFENHYNRNKTVDRIYHKYYAVMSGLGSSVGIATELRAGRSGIESRWRRDFPPVQTGPGTRPASCKIGTRSFPGVKCGRGMLLTTHPLLVSRSWKSRVITLPTFWATPGL